MGRGGGIDWVRSGLLVWRLVVLLVKAAWVFVAANVAYVVMGFFGGLHRAAEYCPPGDDPGPIDGCYPSFEQDAWAHVELWGGTAGLTVVLSAPAWYPPFHRWAERRHLERRRRAAVQRP